MSFLKSSLSSYVLTRKNSSTYCLQITGDEFMPVYASIQQQIPNTRIKHDILVFSANQAPQPLQQYMESKPNQRLSHKEVITLVKHVTTQLHHLRELGFGVYGFDIHDILCIDNTFVIGSAQHVLPLYNDMFIFTSLFDIPAFSNPELDQLKTLPSTIHYKCGFYSLGMFVIYALLLSNDMEPIRHTKLYWFVQRCIQEDIEQRTLLFI